MSANKYIRAVIIDDEAPAGNTLREYLKYYCPRVQVLAMGTSVDEAIQLLQELAPNLLFLDIDLHGRNGFEVLRHLPDYEFEVIFVTAHANFSIDALRLEAADYLLKPVLPGDLISAVDRAETRIKKQSRFNQISKFADNYLSTTNDKLMLLSADRIFVSVPLNLWYMSRHRKTM